MGAGLESLCVGATSHGTHPRSLAAISTRSGVKSRCNAYGKLPQRPCVSRAAGGGSTIDRDEVLWWTAIGKTAWLQATKLKTVLFHAQNVNRAFGEMGEMFSRSARSGSVDFDSPAPKSVRKMRISSAGKWTPSGASSGNSLTRDGSVGGFNRK